MNTLHLLSNWRWTERAEPAVNLVRGLNRIPGIQASFVCGHPRPGDPEDTALYQTRRRGIEPAVLHFDKHLRPLGAWRDIRALRRMIQSQSVDIVHAHMPNALLLGTLAVRSLRTARPLCIGTAYEPEGPVPTLRSRLCLPWVDGWIVMTEQARERLIRQHHHAPHRVACILPAVDIERFARAQTLDARHTFALDPDWVVLGMVARYGSRRKSKWVIEALHRIADDCPKLRLLIVGRGNLREQVEEPAQACGVRDRVVLAGYCRDDRLVEAYASMDALVYPEPGTDKSARAVREALAAGLPVVACRTGILPELVEPGRTGLLADPDPEALACAMRTLYQEQDLRRRMAAEAAVTARQRFAIDAQAARVAGFYATLREDRKGRTTATAGNGSAPQASEAAASGYA